ncbi:hypothetical protein PPYR_09205 [Photinus pyralis]|uniref:Uncharacterized protein n=1 Tax=Photinus pyralis TaxID=7054 RepID=A0A5N4ALJ0_PHOPY|nr:uncharacterized protein LOC116172157 [Photinus pyralis]KAB0798212.1 hypothetical protein PPYR_09205 [Photinus pyralis]
MSDAGYSTAFSYFLLAATGAYCLQEYRCSICTVKLACVSFGIITANALLGAWHWVNKSEGSAIESTYKVTTFLRSILALPFVVTQIWLDYGYDQELANFHSLICLVPFHLYLANKTNNAIIDMLIAVNAASLWIVSWMTNSLHGMAAAGSYLCTHFLFRSGHMDFDQTSVTDLQNYGLICFTYYSLMCLTKNPKC